MKILEDSKLENQDLLEMHAKNLSELKDIFEKREEDLAYRYSKRIDLMTIENE